MNLEPLVDLIEFELIVEKPVLRIAARDVRLKLLTISDNFDFFTKSDCCPASRKKSKTQDVGMKSLMERMGSLCVGKDLEAMQIDLERSEGPLDDVFF